MEDGESEGRDHDACGRHGETDEKDNGYGVLVEGFKNNILLCVYVVGFKDGDSKRRIRYPNKIKIQVEGCGSDQSEEKFGVSNLPEGFTA